MKKNYLSEYFSGVGWKRLSAVEASREKSNQHEFDGVSRLRSILGDERRSFQAIFLYLSDEKQEPVSDRGFLTWYNSRENSPKRSPEWRLYFPTTAVSECAAMGDLLVIGRRPDNTLMVIIAEEGSTIESQVRWLFGITDTEGYEFGIKLESANDKKKLEFVSRTILESMGLVVEHVDQNFLEQMLSRFRGTFPPTRKFSEWARDTMAEVDPLGNADEVLMAWMEREEVLFRTLGKV